MNRRTLILRSTSVAILFFCLSFVENTKAAPLSLATRSGHKVEAELIIPKGAGKSVPVVIFAHGGGCKDIDCKVGPTAYPFMKKHAEWFNHQGFATIRYYRGPTKTAREDVELLLNAFSRAKQIVGINKNKIGFFGHSEGTWQSVVAAHELTMKGEKLGFLILSGTFIKALPDHSEAQLREIFGPVEGHYSKEAFNAKKRLYLIKYLTSWSIPKSLIQTLPKASLTISDIAAIRESFLKMIRNQILSNDKLRSWNQLSPVETLLRRLSEVPIVINQGLLDFETPHQEVESFLKRAGHKNIVFNQFPDLNHYFAEVKYEHNLPNRSWDPISEDYFKVLEISLKESGIESHRPH